MRTRYELNRRSFLRWAGAGSVLVAAPLGNLLYGGSRAYAREVPPKRLLVMYTGHSLGRFGDGNALVPSVVGANYDLRRALTPLGAGPLEIGGNGFDVQQHVTVVSGLEIPWQEGEGSIPPGGRSRLFHYNTMGPQMSGVRGVDGRTDFARGPTCDQIVADAIGGQDTPHRSLSYRVQPITYYDAGSGGGAGRLSYRVGPNGLAAVEPIVSPRLAYEALFANFVPPDPIDAEAAAFTLQRRRSVADRLRERSLLLRERLSGDDRQVMSQHIEALAAVEARLDSIAPPTGEACLLPAEPGEDPPISGAYDGGAGFGDPQNAYSYEEERAALFGDLIAMAFACDLTRVAAVRLSMDSSFMNVNSITGDPSDLHELGHGAISNEAHERAVSWHVKHYARLLAKLREIPEADGSSVLDNTAAVLLFEGGYGYDPESGRNNDPHSTEQMSALVGGCGGAWLNGQHIVAPGRHPASVMITAMRAVGVEADSLGEVDGAIEELLV